MKVKAPSVEVSKYQWESENTEGVFENEMNFEYADSTAKSQKKEDF